MEEITFSEAGAALIAIGTLMMQQGTLSAPACLDGLSDDDLIETMAENGIDRKRAAEILKFCEISDLIRYDLAD
jgi:hypothetical protein